MENTNSQQLCTKMRITVDCLHIIKYTTNVIRCFGNGGYIMATARINLTVDATAKEEALAEINKMAKVMEAEANIETLVVAKGFAECVAVISGDGASIVVRGDDLQAAQISQINEIVYEQSGILPVNIKIIQR